MPTRRTFRIVLVGPQSGAGDRPMKATTTLTYDGSRVEARL